MYSFGRFVRLVDGDTINDPEGIRPESSGVPGRRNLHEDVISKDLCFILNVLNLEQYRLCAAGHSNIRLHSEK